MQPKPSCKKNIVFWTVLGILVTNTLIYYSVKNTFSTESIDQTSHYTTSFYIVFLEDIDKHMSVPGIRNIYDDKMINKVNKSLNEVFIHWLPEEAENPELSHMAVTLYSDQYISTEIVYTFYRQRLDHRNICNTIDMKTGEAVYLDDLIEVDEEFSKLLLTEGVLKLPYDWKTGEADVDYKNSDRYTKDEVLENLKMCSEPFNKANWRYKPTFYLKERRLYLLHVLYPGSRNFIDLDRIEDKLKVDMW